MDYVYLVWDTSGLRMVCKNKIDATLKVNSIASDEYGFSLDDTPLDYSGAIFRYGWIDAAWWTKELIY